MASEKNKIGKGRVFLLIICILVFIFSSALVIKHFVEVNSNKDVYEQLSGLVDDNNDKDNEANEKEPVPDYSAVIEQNADFVGWIKVPNTEINHPVVKTDDNSYYLNHDFNKKYDYRGAIFMDYRNDPINLDASTIIYGHNCYDTTMFSELAQYEDIEFYKKSPVIEFNTIEQTYKWKVYAAFVASSSAKDDDGYIFNYIYPYMDGENFTGFINEVNKRRLYATDVDITDDDKMLVLQTCVRTLDLTDKYGRITYRAGGTLVVVARALRDGESAEVDVSKAYINENPKYPQLFYTKHGIENPYKDDKKWYPQEVVQND